jgi:formylglycine-generating enzyme required for sulfatase activity
MFGNHLDADVAFRKIAANMVTIEGGRIFMKNEGTSRRWTVDVSPFKISKFVVTREDYFRMSQSQLVNGEDGNKPVIDVSWLEAIEFCNLLSQQAGLKECYSWNPDGEVVCDWSADGFRLPSEAEWEFACRAGSNEVRYGELDDIAWYRENSDQRLQDVGTKQPNALGLYDMLGNVWEWCWDIFDAEVYGPYRVFRGGGWSDFPHSCRASCRRKSHPTFRMDDLGFRLAQSLD